MQRSVCTLIKFKLVLLRQQQYFRRVLLPPSPHIDTVEGKEFPASPHDRAPNTITAATRGLNLHGKSGLYKNRPVVPECWGFLCLTPASWTPSPRPLPAVPRLRSTATQRTQKKMRMVNVHSGWNSRKGELLMALFVTWRSSTVNLILFLRT